jgi:superfamily II DNA or RNA helicase
MLSKQHELYDSVKKELRVKPIVNDDYGPPVPPFNVYRQSEKSICLPQFYGQERCGPATDTRPKPQQISTSVRFVGKLRTETHQPEALCAALECGHGVLSLPCGFGKTTVALAIAIELGHRTMIVVHKEFLANQWRERIQQFCPGSTIGIVQGDKIDIECDFVIAMLQTLSTRAYEIGQFESIGTLLIDEAHHVCARVFSQALFKVCPKHTFGLSATPVRKDGLTKVLHWFLGPTFFSVEREHQKQVEMFPIDFDCEMFKMPPPTTRAGKLSLATMITDLTEIVERNDMLIKLIKRASKGSRQLLVLSDRRAHCEYLQQQFPDSSGLYIGGMKEAAMTESSAKKIIFATFRLAHEGLDIPTLDTMILATPKSDIIQSIGRIMRETKRKKNNPNIYDIRDNWSVMHAMYNKRLAVYRRGGFAIDGAVHKEPVPKTPSVCLF